MGLVTSELALAVTAALACIGDITRAKTAKESNSFFIVYFLMTILLAYSKSS
jgi:small basic protein